jgi:hypothetical protein
MKIMFDQSLGIDHHVESQKVYQKLPMALLR